LGTGLFLKVLADGLAQQVDRAYSLSPSGLGALDVLLMAVAFGIQIYFDFSSYTRMACGSALLCGIRLVDNFNYPYQATSPADFWNRWHMSLSRWIRDYLFFPLVGKKATLWAMCRAALITMTICGIWHGAGWNYVLWGFYHGCLIAGYHILTYRSRHAQRAVPAAPPVQAGVASRLLGMSVTYLLVSLGWLWFRSNSLAQATTLWAHLLSPWRHLKHALPGTFYLHTACLVAVTLSMPIWLSGWQRAMNRLEPGAAPISRGPAWLQGAAVGFMVVLALVYYQGQSAFIYFQF
jgi:D-alanyl-lipoteichoic acid acyltransferase DltB (MBOAT superfamily)